MTIAKDFVAKLAVAFVAVAMVLSAFAATASAQTTEELQAMINDLLAQIAALESGSGDAMAAGVCPYTWTRDLSSGSTGMDVMKLQQFLNSDADTRVAVEGAGSPGNETEYYGPATAAAVSKFQVKYRSDILSPANLVNPTGYFGPSSRAKANMLCVAAPADDSMDDADDSMDDSDDSSDDSDDSSNPTLSGEASLDSFDLEDGESNVEEGEDDVEIATLRMEFTDGDAEISRIDLTVASSGVDSWDVFDTISLWVDGDKVAEVDASDRDEYLDEDTGELRFSGLDIFAGEDEKTEVVVAASIQNNVDNTDLGDFDLEVTSMRFFDADGVATTEDNYQDLGAGNATVTFEVKAAGSDEELKISLSDNNPDSTDIVVDTDVDTNDVTILVAEFEAQDNDIDLNNMVVKVETTGASTTKVVDDIRVVIDGEEFDAENLVSTNKGTISKSQSRYVDNDVTDDAVWYAFDIDGDVTFDEDDKVDVEVVVDLNDTDDGNRYANGTQIKASITSVERAVFDAEGADDLAANQFKGTAIGDTHTLVAEGILVPVDGFSATESTLGQNDTIGEFTLEFEVTAVENDFYIYNTATSSNTATTGIVFSVSGGTATVTAALDSTADEDTTDVFTVREGQTETFTLTVTVDPAAAGTFRVGLTEVHYTDQTDGVTSTSQYDVTPVTDFRSAQKAINN